jgi:hypothetical protein
MRGSSFSTPGELEEVTMSGSPRPDPTLAVRFVDEGDLDAELVLRDARVDFDRAPARLALAELVYARREELVAWLAADAAHPRLLLSDPQSALREAFPDLEIPQATPVGRELVDQLLRFRDDPVAGVVTFTPPEVFAERLLRDVADDAAARPNGYDELFSDIRGTVSRVEAGRFEADVINRVVEGISRAHGLPVPAPLQPARQPAWSALAAFADEHPGVREQLE